MRINKNNEAILSSLPSDSAGSVPRRVPGRRARLQARFIKKSVRSAVRTVHSIGRVGSVYTDHSFLFKRKDGDNVTGFFTRLIRPLRSRKVRVALATVAAAFAVEFGLGVSEELLLTILGVGVSLILGIAHEDAGQKSAGDRISKAISEL
jgi:hypothetical protein